MREEWFGMWQRGAAKLILYRKYGIGLIKPKTHDVYK
jgi:hypothetical protein